MAEKIEEADDKLARRIHLHAVRLHKAPILFEPFEALRRRDNRFIPSAPVLLCRCSSNWNSVMYVESFDFRERSLWFSIERVAVPKPLQCVIENKTRGNADASPSSRETSRRRKRCAADIMRGALVGANGEKKFDRTFQQRGNDRALRPSTSQARCAFELENRRKISAHAVCFQLQKSQPSLTEKNR